MSELTILCIKDGKPGHEKQSQALIEGIEQFYKITLISSAPLNKTDLAKAFLLKKFPLNTTNNNVPDIIIGTGHRTHLTVLAAKKVFNAKSVVLMNPSIPATLFDCVITPSHDGFIEHGNRLNTPLALAPIIDSKPDKNLGLLLIGGTNNHFHWNSAEVTQHVKSIVLKYPTIQWQLTTSRRTPNETLLALIELQKSLREQNTNQNFSVFDANDQDKGWLANAMSTTSCIWVTIDSASMLAEALNTSANVGVIDLPESKLNNKLAKTRDNLLQEGWVGIINNEKFQSAPMRDQPLNSQIGAAKKLLTLLGLIS